MAMHDYCWFKSDQQQNRFTEKIKEQTEMLTENG